MCFSEFTLAGCEDKALDERNRKTQKLFEYCDNQVAALLPAAAFLSFSVHLSKYSISKNDYSFYLCVLIFTV